MKTQDKFDGNHYITAQVIIPADDFAREMLGQDPTPAQISNFIKDHASLMEMVYGTARITDRDSVLFNIQDCLDTIEKDVAILRHEVDSLYTAHLEESVNKSLTKTPWWKKILGL